MHYLHIGCKEKKKTGSRAKFSIETLTKRAELSEIIEFVNHVRKTQPGDNSRSGIGGNQNNYNRTV